MIKPIIDIDTPKNQKLTSSNIMIAKRNNKIHKINEYFIS